MLNYLGIQYVHDGGQIEIELLHHSDFTLVSDLDFIYRGGYDAHYRVDHILSDEAELLFTSEDEVERMFLLETEVYKAISSSIIFGALTDGANLNKKAYLISEMVDCFLDSTLISSEPETEVTPLDYGLNIYPNPFKDFCTIEFEIEKSSQVRIEIFNGQGQLITGICNGFLSQGRHQYNWDANGGKLRIGLYFVKVTVKGKFVVKNVVLK